MRVLLVIEKYQSGNPRWPLATNESSFGQTLSSTGLAQVHILYFDEVMDVMGQTAMAEHLLFQCASVQPDLVALSPMGWEYIDPPRTIMQAISKTMGIKTVLLRFDGVGPSRDIFNRSWFPFVDFMVLGESLAHLGYTKNPKAIRGWACPNPNHYFDRKLERNIDVSFLGSLHKPHREEYCQFLRDHRINIVTAGGLSQEEIIKPIPWADYIGIVSQSKIGLNFCRTREDLSQMKGRVFDLTAAKTFLLEEAGLETREFFEDGKEFVMFRNKEDLLEKVRYYLAHDEERERIAKAGHKKTTTLYNASNMWGYLFKKMGFEIPERLAENKHFQELYWKLEAERQQ